MRGKGHSDATRAAMSAAHTGKIVSEEAKERMRRARILQDKRALGIAAPRVPYVLKAKERGMRKRLEETRIGVTQKFTVIAKDDDGEIYEVEGYVQSGLYPDGKLGELFVKIGKAGSSETLLDQWAVAVSTALQYGAPVDAFLKKFDNTRFEPSGGVKGVAGITRCTSLVDLIARWALSKYGQKEEK